MKKASINPMISVALLAISQVAAAADCLVYQTSGPGQLSLGSASVDTPTLSHTVVLRTPGFNQNPIEFMIFPPALAKERFSVDATAEDSGSPSNLSGFALPNISTAVIPQGFPSRTGSIGSTGIPGRPTTTGSPETPESPGPTGNIEHFPQPGQVVVMSNSGFYGDLTSGTDPTKVNEVVAAAIDLAKFGQIEGGIIGVQLNQVQGGTLNVVVVPIQQSDSSASDSGGNPSQFDATEGVIRFRLDNGNRAIVGDMNLLAVDDISNPTIEVQYQGKFNGNLAKRVSC